MKYKCLNCGCVNSMGMKQDNITLELQNFKDNSGALYCCILDENYFISASVLEKCITKPIEKKIIALFKSMAEVRVMAIRQTPEIITLIEDFDVILKGFLMMVGRIASDRIFITIMPPWLNIAEIQMEFKNLVEIFSRFYNSSKNQEFTEYLVSPPPKIL